MKTYKVKNYKGNLVESLSKFQKSYKGMKIVEACEDGDDLKIKAEESKQKIKESSDFWSALENDGGFSVGWDESNGDIKAFQINTERDMYYDGSLERDCIIVFSRNKKYLKGFFDENEIAGIEINKLWNLKPGQEIKYGYDDSDDVIDRGIIRRIF